jgi:hypothetical protein
MTQQMLTRWECEMKIDGDANFKQLLQYGTSTETLTLSVWLLPLLFFQ